MPLDANCQKNVRSGKSTVIVSQGSTTQQMCFGDCTLKRPVRGVQGLFSCSVLDVATQILLNQILLAVF